ncbi:MAG: alpha-D-ribose 1-methylphosphonate 5-triphosphate diphosphatase [Rhodobacteraceae bacterium]|nr:alpha-D-ribose 1-methylphosphonate 5-triphosphate diphosphatase [Paracoccaceae bacterium]
MLEMDVIGAQVLHPDGLKAELLSLADGYIVDAPSGRAVDLSGFIVLPGLIDLHGDGFERHVAPRRGAMSEMDEGLIATEAELAANGITTAYLAQFWSWEGGLRGPDFASKVMASLARVRDQVPTDLHAQMRFEIHLLEDCARLPQMLSDWGVDYVVFNDHLPHDRLAEGRKPPRLTGQALKAGRNPEAHFEFLLNLHSRRGEVPAAMDAMTADLAARGIRLGSHDDADPATRTIWRKRGARVSEFPETLDAAQAARDAGDHVVMGAPNLVRGGSHKGNVSALEVVRAGLCDALASDYHYPSPRRAALGLIRDHGLGWDEGWGLVSSGPARVMGMQDRGTLAPGMRADMVILDATTLRVAATLSGGRASFMSGDVAARLLAA